MSRSSAPVILIALASVAALPVSARAQGVSVDVGAGRFVYDAISASVPSDNLIGVVRFDGARDVWVFGAVGAPLGSQDTLWFAGGAGGRLLAPVSSRAASVPRLSVGADLSAHGFTFRDAVVDGLGAGATLEALPLVRLDAGLASVEARAGWRGHTVSFGGLRENRGVVETGVRAGYGVVLRAEAVGRWVRAAEGAYPFAGAALHYRPARFGVWAHGGRWLASDLDEVAWGVGAEVVLGARVTFWAGMRQEAPDPLYWNAPRRSWSVGVTSRLQRRPLALAPAPRTDAGRVVVRLRAADAPAGMVSIAGDFNAWVPQPMTREGDDWIVHLPIAPGVYNYAFRSERGEWFVPASMPGRREDGMGGHLAVLVVS